MNFDEIRRIARRACWPMIRGYSARDLGRDPRRPNRHQANEGRFLDP
jgi:hypothetical protein